MKSQIPSFKSLPSLFLWLTVFLPMILAFLQTPAMAQERSSSRSYRIGPRDQIQVRVEEMPNLESAQEVAEDGTLVLPVVGSIRAQGLTEQEFAQRLRDRLLKEGLRKATVHVTVSGYKSRPVAMLGSIKNPGNHFVPGSASLLDMLTMAGGLTPEHGQSVYIRRRAENGLTDQVEISVVELIEAGNSDVNLPILAGDHINVPQAREFTIHFLGEVNQPGSHTFRSNQRVTLLTAIARAGGLTEVASNKIRILRDIEGQERQAIPADYRRILGGKAPDINLKNGDLVVVKESFF
jgi:polysaccharide export outer membrane protein